MRKQWMVPEISSQWIAAGIGCPITSAEYDLWMTNQKHTPDAILQTAFSFWSSKVLLTAVEFGVFTQLGERRLTGPELGSELQLHPRAFADFFDALVAMKFLGRE